MPPRKSRQKKKHYLRRFLITLGLLVVIAGTGIIVGRHIIREKSQAVIAKILPSGSSGASHSLAPLSPAALAQKLNDYSSSVVSGSHGLINQTNASVNGNTVTYTLKSSKINSTIANALLVTSGDQLEQVAHQAIAAMKANGTSQPKVIIQLTDANGNSVKTLTYTK